LDLINPNVVLRDYEKNHLDKRLLLGSFLEDMIRSNFINVVEKNDDNSTRIMHNNTGPQRFRGSNAHLQLVPLKTSSIPVLIFQCSFNEKQLLYKKKSIYRTVAYAQFVCDKRFGSIDTDPGKENC